jgi:hypothetical protein
VNDKLISCLIKFSLRLLVLFSDIINFILLSLREYVNIIRIKIIIIFVMIVVMF